MKILSAVALNLSLIFGSLSTANARNWRGIVPLQSNNTDVERILGPPRQRLLNPYYYNLREEVAVVWFQSEACDGNTGVFGIGWNVPVGTVMEIGVIPKASYPKDKYVAGSGFKVEHANAGFDYYTDENEGLFVETYNGLVTNLTYMPPKQDEALRCPRVQTCCIDFFSIFDEFKDLTLRDERARLDNFAIEME